MISWFKLLVKSFWSFLKKNKVRKIIDWTLFVFLLAVLALVIIPLLPKAPYSLKMVTSNSMRPTFSTGALVVVTPEENYQIGQVITYQASEYEQDIVTHRIVGKDEGGFITKGDANNIEDERIVSENQIKGKVIFHLPLAGYAVNFIQKPLGFILIIIIPAGLIIYDEIKKIIKEMKKPEVSS